MIFLIVSSILMLVVKRNKETFYIFGMSISLTILIIGIMLYIAKKGGISKELQDFYFFNSVIKTYAQYFYITTSTLGFIVAIGRYSFPVFLVLLAIHYSGFEWLKKNKFINYFIFFPPMIVLILNFPSVFYALTDSYKYFESVLSNFSLVWILLYVLVSIILLIVEAFSIQIIYFKKRFIAIIFFVFSILFLYLLYFGQDPIQIYQFYFWGHGIYYMNSTLSAPVYLTIFIINVVLAIVGFTALLKYTKDVFDKNKEKIAIDRNEKLVSAGASIFVHSMKNQLLANRVIFKRLNQQLVKGLMKPDVKMYIDQLFDRNELMFERINSLNDFIKPQTAYLRATSVNEIITEATNKFYEKYPNHHLITDYNDTANVFADLPLLSEAIYNLLTNAQEAIIASHRNDHSKVKIKIYTTREYVIIEVEDKGIGIKKEKMRKIMDPFYSTKNSNYNWGVGLHYTQTVVKEHFGVLRFESVEGEGTVFFLYLPKLK